MSLSKEHLFALFMYASRVKIGPFALSFTESVKLSNKSAQRMADKYLFPAL
jgi:hypothetical protein